MKARIAKFGFGLSLALTAVVLVVLIRSFVAGAVITGQWVVFTEKLQNDGTIPQDHVADISAALSRGLMGIGVAELTEDAGYEPEPLRWQNDGPTSLLAGQNGIAAALGFRMNFSSGLRGLDLVFPIWIPLIVAVAMTAFLFRLYQRWRVRPAGFPIKV